MLAEVVSVDARQHEVEHGRVERLLARQPQPVRTDGREVHGEAIRDHPGPQALSQPRLVLDHQHPHDQPILRDRSWTQADGPASRARPSPETVGAALAGCAETVTVSTAANAARTALATVLESRQRNDMITFQTRLYARFCG
ncbi:MAG TPA: hypothetical protein VFB84_20785 [Micromonosporaceae bacterium]|nr:hypothetical protein [Micromonosporaceae bacterium]